MPLMAFELPPQHPAAAHRVAQASGGAPGYPRLSPYSPAARAAIRELFEDLAQHAFLSGIVIHDDATLSDFEDDSGWARAHHRDVWRLPESVGAIRSDPDAFARWTRLKTEHLSLFAREVGDAVRRTHPGAKLARNYYARPILEPQSQAWFAQSLPDALAHFDWVALMAMPYMEGARDPERWLTALVHRVAQVPGALEKVVFEIQTRDWRSGQPLPAATVERHLRTLQRAGARSIGYYPDDFIGDQPPLGAVRSTISVRAPMSVWPPGPRPPGVSR